MCKVYKHKPTEYFGSNMFLVECDGEYAVVDPSISYEALSASCGTLKIKYVFVTHTHFDHFFEIDSYVMEGAVVIVGREDAPGFSDSYRNCYMHFYGVDKGYYGNYTAVSDTDVLSLGNTMVRIINTPGHTAGGVSYLIGTNLFVGDTVFDGGNYGRCDLPGGNFDVLQASIRRILSLPDETKIYCGHGADTTVEKVKYYFK